MTVEELFDCFKEYFDKILYLDKSQNVYDEAEKEDSETPNLQTMYYKFIKNYGECEVTYWEYSHDENGIYVEFEREVDTE